MSDNLTQPKKDEPASATVESTYRKKPDELSGLNIEAKFRIFDPESGKTIVEGRA